MIPDTRKLDPDMTSTIIVLAILLSGALAAVVAGFRNPAENLSDTFLEPHRWH